MKRLRVRLGERSYDIVIGRDLMRSFGTELKRLKIGSDALIITNSRLRKLYGKRLVESLKRAGIPSTYAIVPDSERAKSISIATSVISALGTYDVGKKVFIIAFGGGVIGDLAGFVASVYKRGIPYVQIPTTLLAQVDSAIGGKVAVDLPIAKNLVGAFYQPRIVLSDVSLISSLPVRQLRSGLSEVIKYGVIQDRQLFNFVEENNKKLLRGDLAALEYVVSRASSIKAQIVARDEFDRKDLRAILNYGHTIGHAIEAASAYSGEYNHGEAIAIGMVTAARMASELGLLREPDACRVEELISKVGLPTRIKGLSLPAIYRAHLHDKKFVGSTNRFVLPQSIGRVKIVKNVPIPAIRNALKESLAT